WQIDEQWSVGANFDWAQEENQGAGGGDAEWIGLAGYARYNILENLYVALRGEWFDDADGARASAFNLTGPGGVVVPDVEVWEITATLGYSPVKDLMTRLEFRHDNADQEVFLDGSGLSDTQNTIAVEVIYSF
ncbi:MAG TPA: outer membrane beta-barrel protein, partial [bacterium]|nr:outer membrane beta-barrel protein [bacterium]